MSRYHRQVLLPQIGEAGQQLLRSARVLLVGCGALGTVVADQLVRAGVGHLRICDRDLVEETNLQRQVLFDEDDARKQTPKAVAAKSRLEQVNSAVAIEAHVVDVHSGNIEKLAGLEGDLGRVNVILDGTDNVETRYLINDFAVKHGVPWIYGACVGVQGRVMGIVPGQGPCLRCLFEQPAAAGELETCDTTGVLAPAAGVIASLQVVAAMKILLGYPTSQLTTVDVWSNRFHAVEVTDARRADCPACGRRHFEFLDRPGNGLAAALCGRGAVQVRPARETRLDLDAMQRKLAAVGEVNRTAYYLKCQVRDNGTALTVFPDGRAMIHGTADISQARSIYARYIGS